MRTFIRLLTIMGLIAVANSFSWAAPTLSPSPMPKSLHVEYSVTRIQKAISPAGIEALIEMIKKDQPKDADKAIESIRARVSDREYPAVSVEYWASAPCFSRWVEHATDGFTKVTNGVKWADYCEWQGSKVLSVSSLDRKDRSNSGLYFPGVSADEIPFLGFQQPVKEYRRGKTRIVKTADGWQEHCRVLHPYAAGNSTLEAVLTYNREGRLVRFQRDLREGAGEKDCVVLSALHDDVR